MSKPVLALFLALFLSLPVQAQQLTAEGCQTIGQIFYQEGMEKAKGKKVDRAVAEMKESMSDADPSLQVLVPFYEDKIKELYQSKKTARQWAQDFVAQCFDARGDIPTLMGKKI